MVSNRQSLLISALLMNCVLMGADDSPISRSAPPRFLVDDPLWSEPAPRPVTGAKPLEINDLYDFLDGSFVVPHEKKTNWKAGSHARNINTLGEVPDSEWYTNRHGRVRMSIEELVRGPGNTTPPEPGGKWRIIASKSNGVTPGFRIEDANGHKYLLKFDPSDYPELASGPDVIGSKLYYALGYNTPENYIVNFRRDQLTLPDSTATWKDSAGKKHLLTHDVINRWLANQPKDSDGRYRAMASRMIEGKVLGPFVFRGTRSDDPNDVVPHEQRRELRGMNVFAAWFNDTDTRAINSLDTLISDGGTAHIKHYRIDWGASLGSDSLGPKDIRRGHDYLIESKSSVMQAASFGLYLPEWMRTKYPKIRGVGTFDYKSFTPLTWKNNYPVAPFVLMDDDDAFWAVRQVMAFTDAEIRALVKTGGYTDPRATAWIAESLIQRRNMIGEAYLSKGLALDRFKIEDGTLKFDDLAVQNHVSPARQYSVEWSDFDNTNGARQPRATEGDAWRIPTAGTAYLAARIQSPATKGDVTVYLRQSTQGWSVVGLDRRYQ